LSAFKTKQLTLYITDYISLLLSDYRENITKAWFLRGRL